MSQPRKTANLSDSVRHHLDMYALAASAAGVSLLALTPPAEARIVYTPAHVAIHNHYGLDLNHDGIRDFFFVTSLTNHSSAGEIKVWPQQSKNLIWGTKGRYESRLASALSAGVRVGSNTKLRKSNRLMYEFNCWTRTGGTTITCTYSGNWKNVKNRYLGLEFYIKGQAHYGWARLTVGESARATLTGYAYETIANKPIITGKTKGRDVITVQPASLAHLARGASAIQAWRKESAGVTH